MGFPTIAALLLLLFGTYCMIPQQPVPGEHTLFAKLRKKAALGTITVAHRGASSTHPENTLPAFREAVRLGVGMVEFDVRQTADGEWVCLHDATLDRTSDAEQVLGRRDVAIARLESSGLERFDAGAWKGPEHRGTRIPTLAAALEAFGTEVVPMIEHKAGSARDVVALLRRLDRTEDVLLQSFDWGFLREVARLAPEVPLGALGPNDEAKHLDGAALREIASFGARLVHWSRSKLRAEEVESAHGAGLLVCTYTIDDDSGLVGATTLGIDMVTTNNPARHLELVRGREGSGGARR